jgi:hypothetical protein
MEGLLRNRLPALDEAQDTRVAQALATSRRKPGPKVPDESS